MLQSLLPYPGNSANDCHEAVISAMPQEKELQDMHAQGTLAAAASPTSLWLPKHLDVLNQKADTTIPLIPHDIARPLVPEIDLWDMWPAQLADGRVAEFDGVRLWFILSAPMLDDPDQRHGIARIRLFTEQNGTWQDCGNAFPDGFTPGSREWAGSAVFSPSTNALTLHFTAAGERGDGATNWAQRLFSCVGTVTWQATRPSIAWAAPFESVVADGGMYQRVDATVGEPGFIKGFRDPAFFQDPANGLEYLLFTASLADADSRYDGAIGIAALGSDGKGQVLPPLIGMDGVNNEPERPHIICSGGLYFLFFSTQRRMFAPNVRGGPNGLYAMVSESLFGNYRPVNGSGLVAANPEQAPFQAYSWWVTANLDVYGFVDLVGHGSATPTDTPEWRRAHFGGVPAPRFTVHLDQERVTLIR
jgi:levansucrase